MRQREMSGRGTGINPANRFERLVVAPDPDATPGDCVPTVFFRDAARSILAENDSPDVDFRFSLNPYRGCEHGCIYCYARPTHEYLGFSAGLDFETRVLVKHDAPELLRRTLSSKGWEPQVVALSGNTDCYQPVERQLKLTRDCLVVFSEFRNPVSIITKSALVARDVDILASLAAEGLVHVSVSITTLDGDVARRMEPRASRPGKRLEAIERLSSAGVPVRVMVAPMIPGLNDEEIPRILEDASAAGARSSGYVLLRLTRPVDDLFGDWVERNFPHRRARILGRIRECRSGRLSDPRFGLRKSGEGEYSRHIEALFRAAARRYGLDGRLPDLNVGSFRRPPRSGDQLSLF